MFIDITRHGAALWSSAFRPFFLLGASYGLALMAGWSGVYLGIWGPPSQATPLTLWHGHEMLFGFATAIVVGIMLTALPGWPGTAEVQGVRLIALVGLWMAGRAALWGAASLPPIMAAAIDLLFLPAVFVSIAAQLLRIANRRYLLLLPILIALFVSNLVWHAGAITADARLAGLGLRASVHVLICLFVLVGGVLTPIFTGNALRDKARGGQAPFVFALDAAAFTVVLVLAALDLAGASSRLIGIAALGCAVVHGWRVTRWKGWRVVDVPLVLTMHLAFAWLLIAFALKAAAELTGVVPEAAWMHAFTVGCLGMMMLGLMTRVVLRHTGRALIVPPAMLVAYALMSIAAIARLAAVVYDLGHAMIAFASLAWAAPFAIYLALFGWILLSPSLPRRIPDRN